MLSVNAQLPMRGSGLFNFFVFLTLIAYISRVAEIFPPLAGLRITLILFCTTLALLVFTKAKNNIVWRGNTELFLITAFLIIGIVGIPFAAWPRHAFLTCQETLAINLVIFFFCQAVMTNEKKILQTVFMLITSSSLLLYGLVNNPHIEEGSRISATMTYDSNDIALLFGFIFPLVLSFFSTSKFAGKLLSAIVLTGLVVGIVKTGSRGGMIAFGASLVLIFFSSHIGLKAFYKLLLLTMVIMFVISPKGQTVRDRFSTLLSGQDYNLTNTESAAGGRLAIWRSGIDLFGENVFLGVGAGNSSTAMGQKHGDESWRTMHNSYLQAGVEMGFLGLAIYLAMLSKVMKNCKAAIVHLSVLPSKHRDGTRLLAFASGLRIGFVSYLIAGFFLSQAFSLVVPLSLAISNRLLVLARTANSGQLSPAPSPQ